LESGSSNSEERAVLEDHICLKDHELDCFLQWVTVLNETMQSIWNGSNAACDLELFFIKLYGLLVEGKDQVEMHFLPVKAIDLLNDSDLEAKIPGEAREISKTFHETFETILKLISKQDLETIEFLRHKASHPYVESYRLVYSKNRKPRFELRGESKIAVRNRIREHLDKSGGVELFAHQLVGRFKDHIPRLLAVIQIQCARHNTIGGKIFIKRINSHYTQRPITGILANVIVKIRSLLNY